MANLFRCGGGSAKNLLWENPNPTTAAGFVAQTIELDLSKYTHIVVEGHVYYNQTYTLASSIVEVGASAKNYIIGASYSTTDSSPARIGFRTIQALANGVVFGSGSSVETNGSHVNNADYMAIPDRIFGIVSK